MDRPDPNREHSSIASSFSRRTLLATGTAAAVGLVSDWTRPAWSTSPAEEPYRDFLRLSALLLPHRLDKITGERLAAAMKADQPPMSDRVGALLALAAAKRASTVEEFFPFTSGATRTTALRIISGWYLGVVDNVPGATAFANVDALMYGPTSDVMTVPSYAIVGPSAWGPHETAPLAFMPSF